MLQECTRAIRFWIALLIGKMGTGRPSLVGCECHPSTVCPNFYWFHSNDTFWTSSSGQSNDCLSEMLKDCIMIGEPFYQLHCIISSMTSKHHDMPLVELSCVGMVVRVFWVGKRGAVSTLTHAAKMTVPLKRLMFSACTVQPTFYERYEWVALSFRIKSSSELGTWYDLILGAGFLVDTWMYGSAPSLPDHPSCFSRLCFRSCLISRAAKESFLLACHSPCHCFHSRRRRRWHRHESWACPTTPATAKVRFTLLL
jgi:hypothetical protein